jgi:hypothetical protein
MFKCNHTRYIVLVAVSSITYNNSAHSFVLPYACICAVFLAASTVRKMNFSELYYCFPFNANKHFLIITYCNEFAGSIHDGTLLPSKFNTQLLITVHSLSIVLTQVLLLLIL